MIRPPRDPADPKAIDEGTDAYDSIDWLIKNVRGHNGRVGMLGVSYDGWLTVMALHEPHPALKAASPQASPADMFLGDDFHHNGAFRLSYGFEYAAHDGDRQRRPAVQVRPARHVRMVPGPGAALRGQCTLLPRQDPDLERLRPATPITIRSGASRRSRGF